MTQSVRQSHLTEERVSIEELVECMTITESLADPEPRTIGIVDDVLTTGRHFKAAQRVLATRFPGVATVGIFIARRAPDSTLT